MLLEILSKHYWILIFTYAFLAIEETLISLIPYFLGIAIDSLILKECNDFYVYIGICLASVVVAILRRVIDTRLYARIWRQLASKKIQEMIDKGTEKSKIVSRSHMLIDYTKFFEVAVPSMLSAIIDIGISIFMLVYFVPKAAVFILPLLAASYYVQHKTSIFQQNIDREIQFAREAANEQVLYMEGYGVYKSIDKQASLLVKSSDVDSINYGLHEFIANAAEVIVILIMLSCSFTTGTIMANLTYVYKMFSKLGIFGCSLVHYRIIKNNDQFLG